MTAFIALYNNKLKVNDWCLSQDRQLPEPHVMSAFHKGKDIVSQAQWPPLIDRHVGLGNYCYVFVTTPQISSLPLTGCSLDLDVESDGEYHLYTADDSKGGYDS